MKTTPIGRFIIVLVMTTFLCVIQAGQAETDIAMPSLSEALVRYPVSETENTDRSVTELYRRISEEDYVVFNAYLSAKGTEMGEHSVEQGVLRAEILSNGASFNIVYDTLADEMKVTYPAGTCSEYMMNLEEHLAAAESFFKEGKTIEAVNEILMIPHYENYHPAQELLRTDTDLAAAVADREAQLAPYRIIGNTVTFGSYEQDRSTKNGHEPIEWIVLDYDETTDRTLLATRYGLVSMPYNDGAETDTAWETCSLRKELNSAFLDEVFTAEEQAAIAVTEVDNSPSQGLDGWNTNGGNNTQDRVFLLSYAEAKQYFGADDGVQSETARISATPYANANGGAIAAKAGKAKTTEGKQAVWWWLRSPGNTQTSAMTVMNDGSIGSFDVHLTQGVVRPALWLNLRPDNALPLIPATPDKQAGGILPSHTEVEGIGLPSLSEALARYPDSETENVDGSVTEIYTDVSEENYNTFSGWLREQGAKLGDHKAEDGVLTAEVKAENANFIFVYDSETEKAEVTYPAGTFNAWKRKSEKLLYSAKLFLDDGEQDDALAEFLKIPNFREYAPAEQFLREHPEFETAVVAREERLTAFRTVWNKVTFGRYMQDGKAKKDLQPIEWIVINYDKKENKALLLSRYSLDGKRYNESKSNGSVWETCTLRAWLNGEFLNTAFTQTEQAAILITEVDNSPSQGCIGFCIEESGNNTKDKVFLLSFAEADRYLGTTGSMEGRAAVTSYALSIKDVKELATMGTGKTAQGDVSFVWALRSPGDMEGRICVMNQDGWVYTGMGNDWIVPIRPAIWVDLATETGISFAHAMQGAFTEGILPPMTDVAGLAMPSLGEAIGRYPVSETKNGDGGVTYIYNHISEKDYNAFSVYLQHQGAELGNYQVQSNVLTAEIMANNSYFNLKLDSDSGETEITYPAGTRDTWTGNSKKKADSAHKLLLKGKINEALLKIIRIPEYKELFFVKELIQSNKDLATALTVREKKLAPYRTVGERVSFGRYEQDFDFKNGPEEIEWIVLDYNEAEDKSLLMSRYCLEAMKFNSTDDFTWETSLLRQWLNGPFILKTFNANEQAAILTTEVDNSPSQACPEYLQDGGNNTQDKVFILSCAEAEQYLGASLHTGSVKASAAATTYALKANWGYLSLKMSQGKTSDGEQAIPYWLRSPGSRPGWMASIVSSGYVWDQGYPTDEILVRPVFWLDLKADFFAEEKTEGSDDL